MKNTIKRSQGRNNIYERIPKTPRGANMVAWYFEPEGVRQIIKGRVVEYEYPDPNNPGNFIPFDPYNYAPPADVDSVKDNKWGPNLFTLKQMDDWGIFTGEEKKKRK